MAVYTANNTRDQQLAGGSEADTFYTGHNSVVLTGGGAGDTFVFQHLPWNNTGHVRDFALGVDKLDFSALFAASGYTGSNPVADGYLRFASDGAGGTRLLYDPDGSGTAHQWPVLVTTLDNISPTGLTWAQLSNSAPPPARERIATTDGGYVEVWHEPSGSFLTFHLQKYNAAGTAVGPEHMGTTNDEVHVVALSDGGYAVASYQNFMSNLYMSIGVYDAASAFEGGTQGMEPARFAQQDFDIAASPHGGFIIATASVTSATASMGTSSHLIMYDNSGAEVERARVAGSAPQIDVLSDGTYRISWTDDGAARTLNIDPRNPPDLSSPAQPSFTAIDNVAPGGGGGIATTIDLSSGVGWTNDATPTLRFTVTEPGELDLVFNTSFPGPLVAPDRTIVITAQDVANGYIDVPFTLPSGESTYFAQVRIADVNGVVTEVQHFALNIDTVTPPPAGISTVTDDAGSRTGTVANGGSTDDTTPTLQIAYTPSGTEFDNDQIQLYVDGSPVGAPVTASADDAARGYIIITSPVLAPGQHSFSATMTDGAANVSPLGASYTITVGPDSGGTPGQTFTANNTRDQVMTGTSGDDIFYTGHNSVLLTGGGGGDDFIYQHVPWNNSGHVRDFTSGVDVLDLRPLFQAAGYTGSDPIADGYLRFASDGAGGTQILFDRDGSGSANPWPSLVTTLDNIQPSGIHTGDWLFA